MKVGNRMKMKFLKSADGCRLVRLRQVQSVRLDTTSGNGFVAARIIANLKGGADPVTLAAYTALANTPEARNLPIQARADMDRLLALLNGGRLSRGEKWPKE